MIFALFILLFPSLAIAQNVVPITAYWGALTLGFYDMKLMKPKAA